MHPSSLHIVCASDIHLGRQVHVPGNPTAPVVSAWERLITWCLDPANPVDIVCLAGDLIDGDGLFIEMYGVFRRGISRLIERGIFVVAVAGNHDAGVLSTFSRTLQIPGFRILGIGGQWERVSFEVRGRPVHIDGYSFAHAHCLDNPLQGTQWPKWEKGEVGIGLLHADVDVPHSRYAPVRLPDFATLPHHLWILGHVHVPQVLQTQDPLVLYCGSLQGLDVTETGRRGAWHVAIDEMGEVHAEPLTLAAWQWEQFGCDLSDLTAEDGEAELLQRIEREMVARALEGIEGMVVRLRWHGRTPWYTSLRAQVDRVCGQIDPSFQVGHRWIPYAVESIENDTRPDRDLSLLAEGDHLIAILARRLLIVEQGEGQFYDAVMAKWYKDPFIKQCSPELIGLDEDMCRALYLRQGYALLEELLQQREEIYRK